MELHVAQLEVFTSPDHPLSDVDPDSDKLSDELLVRLGQYRVDAQQAQGLTHLYTGHDLESNTVGIAYTKALCNPRFGAGLTQASNNAYFDSLVAAHEIGHNFGAPHDGEGDCSAQTGSFIMASTLNGSDTFSPCSLELMQAHMAGASCLVALPTADIALRLQGNLPPLVLGSSRSLVFAIDSVGSETATGVTAEFSIPASLLAIDTAAASHGDCTLNAATVECTLGTLPGGSGRTVTIEVTAINVGEAELTALAEADVDDNPGNNDAVADVVVESPPPAPGTDSGGGGGGGGATGLGALALLALALLPRRRIDSRHPGRSNSPLAAGIAGRNRPCRRSPPPRATCRNPLASRKAR